MPLGALALLVVAAVIHAAWNLLSKRSQDKQVFLWLTSAVTAVAGAPLALALWTPIPPVGWLAIALSGALQAAYFLLLGGAYQHGDLTLVYPIARGSAVLFVTLGAAAVLQEAPAVLGLAGIALVIGGIYLLHVRSVDRAGLLAPLVALRDRSSRLALLTGLIIASYGVVDKVGVRYVNPWQYLYLAFLVCAVLLTPAMLRRRPAIIREWRAHWHAVGAVAAMSAGAFGLVLTALTLSPVSYVAAVREMSVVFAALFGYLVLREPFGRQKLLGAAVIFTGILAIAFSGR